MQNDLNNQLYSGSEWKPSRLLPDVSSSHDADHKHHAIFIIMFQKSQIRLPLKFAPGSLFRTFTMSKDVYFSLRVFTMNCTCSTTPKTKLAPDILNFYIFWLLFHTIFWVILTELITRVHWSREQSAAHQSPECPFQEN